MKKIFYKLVLLSSLFLLGCGNYYYKNLEIAKSCYIGSSIRKVGINYFDSLRPIFNSLNSGVKKFNEGSYVMSWGYHINFTKKPSDRIYHFDIDKNYYGVGNSDVISIISFIDNHRVVIYSPYLRNIGAVIWDLPNIDTKDRLDGYYKIISADSAVQKERLQFYVFNKVKGKRLFIEADLDLHTNQLKLLYHHSDYSLENGNLMVPEKMKDKRNLDETYIYEFIQRKDLVAPQLDNCNIIITELRDEMLPDFGNDYYKRYRYFQNFNLKEIQNRYLNGAVDPIKFYRVYTYENIPDFERKPIRNPTKTW